MVWGIVRCWMRGEKLCVVDVPLLIESGLWRFVGMTVVVSWCVHPSYPLCAI